MPTATRHPLALILLALLFSTPFGSGYPIFIFTTVAFLVFFIGYVALRKNDPPFLAQQLRTHHPILFYALAAFCLSSVISYSQVMLGDTGLRHKAAASVQYAFYLLMLLYAFSLAKFCLHQKLAYTPMITAYVYGCVVLVFLLLVFYHLGLAAPAIRWATRAPFGEHARIMGMIASVSSLACLVRLIFSWRTINIAAKILHMSILLITMAFLVWTGSRTSMLVTLVLSGGLLAAAIALRKLQTAQTALILLVIVLAVPVAQQFSIFPWTGLGRAIEVSNVTPATQGTARGNTSIGDKITSGRLSMWTQTWAGIKEAPWLGHGPNGYFFHPMHYQNFIHPHNLFLQFLVEWGLVGSTFLLFFLTGLLWHGIKRLPEAFINNDVDYVCAGTIIVALGLTSLTDGVFFISQSLFCITTAFAIFPFLDRQARQFNHAT